MTGNILRALLAACIACAVPTLAAAQDKTPLKILVGFPPGGSADILSRIVADALRDDFSPIVVENKAGAAGRIAIGAAKSAKPDGQTVIIMPNGPMVLFPHVYRKLDYDPVKDFTPISLIARFEFGVVAGPGSHATSIQDMVARIKADPKTGTYGTPGQGTLPHFLGVLFSEAAGVHMTHIPFQGGAPANTALLGGHINYKFDVVSETAELHRAGKVRILAVTGAKRDPQVPDVPTLQEAGIKMEADSWFAMYAPAGIPAEASAKLQRAMSAALRRPEVREKLTKLGYEPVGSNGAELAAVQRNDLRRWEAPIQSAGVKLD